MTRLITLLAGAAVLAAGLGGPVFSQGTPQTMSLIRVDPQSLATGYRTSKVVGSTGATKDSLKALPEFKYNTLSDL